MARAGSRQARRKVGGPRSTRLSRPWLTLAVIGVHALVTRPREVADVLRQHRLLGVDVVKATLAWIVVATGITLLTALGAAGLFFYFGADVPWLILASVISTLALFTFLVINGLSYLLGIEEVSLWHDVLVVSIVMLGYLLILWSG